MGPLYPDEAIACQSFTDRRPSGRWLRHPAGRELGGYLRERRPSAYSGLMPASFTTFAHCARSRTICALNSSGVLPIG